MTIQELRSGRAKTERLHSEALEARLARTARRVRVSIWLRRLADRLAAA